MSKELNEKDEQIEQLEKSNKTMKTVLAVVVGIMLVVVCFAVGYVVGNYLGTESDEQVEEDKKEETETNDPTEEAEKENGEKEETVEKEEDNTVALPTDEELIARSKILKDNFNTLLSGLYSVEQKAFNFPELSMPVYKMKDTSKFVATIDDTFVDHATAWKYVPYYEKDGVYYFVNGSGGIMGAGYFIFEYTVNSKTSTTATVSIEYAECYDEVVHEKISACKNNPWGDTNFIILNLVKVNNKWLIKSVQSDLSVSVLK